MTPGGRWPLRADLVDAHRLAWARVAGAGSWWTGSQRLAIAGESRRALDCDLCTRRRAALSPYGVTGAHRAAGDLPEAAVDAVHRVVTDPARLSRSWVEGLAAHGITDGHYVELLGCALVTFDIDEFHRALGLPLATLPPPASGRPDRYRPGGLRRDLYWVLALDPDAPAAPERDLFPGRTGNALRALSLVPDTMRAAAALNAAHYVPTEHVPDLTHDAGRSLDRAQMELIATTVAQLNGCTYCATGHGALLRVAHAGRSVGGADDATAALTRFARAAVLRTGDLASSRRAVEVMLGVAAVIDAAAVLGAFQRIVRTADATGLDGSAVGAMDLGPHRVEA